MTFAREPGTFEALSRQLLGDAFPGASAEAIARDASAIAEQVHDDLGTVHLDRGRVRLLTGARYGAVFYRRGGVVVTDRFFQTEDGRRFSIAILRNLGTRRRPAESRLSVSTVLVAVLALGLPLVNARSWHILVLVAALGALAVIGVVAARWWRPHLDLLANYRGSEVVLFSSRDRHEYDRVTRALMRAMERRRDLH